MNEIEKSRAQQITKLHGEIIGHLSLSLSKAIKIGELLTEQKESLKHGEWGPWIEANLSFTSRTVRSYMRLHRERDSLKTETVSDLTGAYKFLGSERSSFIPNVWDGFSSPGDLIEYINTCIAGEDELDPDVKWLFNRFTDLNPKDREDLVVAQILEIGKFFCSYRMMAKVLGADEVPGKIYEVLTDFCDLEEDFKPICRGGHCPRVVEDSAGHIGGHK